MISNEIEKKTIASIVVNYQRIETLFYNKYLTNAFKVVILPSNVYCLVYTVQTPLYQHFFLLKSSKVVPYTLTSKVMEISHYNILDCCSPDHLFTVHCACSQGMLFLFKVIPGEAGFRTDCFKIWVYNTKDILLLTSIVVSCPSGIC